MSDITTNPIAEAIKFRQLGAVKQKHTEQTKERQTAATATEQKERRKRVTAYVPRPLAKWLNDLKFETGKDISETVTEALEEYKERHL